MTPSDLDHKIGVWLYPYARNCLVLGVVLGSYSSVQLVLTSDALLALAPYAQLAPFLEENILEIPLEELLPWAGNC